MYKYSFLFTEGLFRVSYVNTFLTTKQRNTVFMVSKFFLKFTFSFYIIHAFVFISAAEGLPSRGLCASDGQGLVDSIPNGIDAGSRLWGDECLNAVFNYDLEALQLCLENGTQTQKADFLNHCFTPGNDHSTTVLGLCCMDSNLPAVTILVDHGAAIDGLIQSHIYPIKESFLFYASRVRNLSLIRILLSLGADVNLGHCEQRENYEARMSPFAGALQAGYVNVAKELVKCVSLDPQCGIVSTPCVMNKNVNSYSCTAIEVLLAAAKEREKHCFSGNNIWSAHLLDTNIPLAPRRSFLDREKCSLIVDSIDFQLFNYYKLIRLITKKKMHNLLPLRQTNESDQTYQERCLSYKKDMFRILQRAVVVDRCFKVVLSSKKKK